MSLCPLSWRPSTRLAIALASAALLGACEVRESDTNVAEPNAVEPAPSPPRVLPIPDPVLDRAALMGAVAEAASAFGAGADDREAQSALDGRRFTINLRFGCGGPAPASGAEPLLWRVRSDTSLEIRATPDLSLDSPALAGILPEAAEATDSETQTVEAVEGFWIARPWLLTDRCPAPNPRTAALGVPPERSVGIAQYYTSEESRVERRGGRAYISTVALQPDGGEAGNAADAADQALPREGLFLSIEGRLRRWPDGKVIRCSATAVSARPACVISIKMDRVAFTRPASGDVIDEWRP